MKINCHEYEGVRLHSAVNVDYLYTIHYFEHFKDYAFKAESHDFWELVYLDNGELILEIEDSENRFLLHHGQIALIPPNIGHNFISTEKHYNLFVISFNSRSPGINILNKKLIYLSSYNQRYIIGQILYEARKSFKKPLSALSFSKIELKQENGQYTLCIIKKLLELLLIDMLRNYNKSFSSVLLRKDFESYSADIINIIHFLRSNIYKKITLPEAARVINMSVSQAQKKFTKEVGKSIMMYFSELRIEEVKFLLRTENISLAEIAERLHYHSVFHLSSRFKKIVGMPPSRYLKSLQEMIDSSL